EGLPREPLEVLQVAPGDEVLLWMGGEPTFALVKQLLEFVLADEVVLVVVENRDEDVQVGQEIGQCSLGPELHGEVGALAPGRERRIQRVMLGAALVAQGLKQASQQCLAAPAWNDGEPGDEGEGPIDQVWPVLASTGE